MELFDAEYYHFIASHPEDDVVALRMKYNNKMPRHLLDSLLAQIEGRRKFASKLSSVLINPEVIIPSVSIGEQATSSEVADFHASLFGRRGRVLDMTAGMGMEAIAFAKLGCEVVAVDINEAAVMAGNRNAKVLGLKNLSFVRGNSVDYLKENSEPFSLIFIDPMRRNSERRFYALSDCSPDVTALTPLLRTHTSRVIVKASPMLDITTVIKQLPHISRILIVSLKSECKEILIDIDFRLPAQHGPEIVAIDLKRDRCEILTAKADAKNYDCVNYPDLQEIDSMISEGTAYLYEPNSSIMKAGLWTALPYSAEHLRPLSPNTHLFFSTMLIKDFPGRKFKLTSHLDKRDIKALKREKRNVMTRNYPVSANELRKKIGVNDGGDNFIIGLKAGATEIPALFDAFRLKS